MNRQHAVEPGDNLSLTRSPSVVDEKPSIPHLSNDDLICIGLCSNQGVSFYMALLPHLQKELTGLRDRFIENTSEDSLVAANLAVNKEAAALLLKTNDNQLLDILLLANQAAIELRSNWKTKYKEMVRQAKYEDDNKLKSFYGKAALLQMDMNAILILALMSALKRPIATVNKQGRSTNRKMIENFKGEGDAIFVYDNEENHYGILWLKQSKTAKEILQKLLQDTWGETLTSVAVGFGSSAMFMTGVGATVVPGPWTFAAPALLGAGIQASTYSWTTDDHAISFKNFFKQTFIGGAGGFATGGLNTYFPAQSWTYPWLADVASGVVGKTSSYLTDSLVNWRRAEFKPAEFLTSAVAGASAGATKELLKFVPAVVVDKADDVVATIAKRATQIGLAATTGGASAASTQVVSNLANNVSSTVLENRRKKKALLSKRHKWTHHLAKGCKDAAVSGAVVAGALSGAQLAAENFKQREEARVKERQEEERKSMEKQEEQRKFKEKQEEERKLKEQQEAENKFLEKRGKKRNFLDKFVEQRPEKKRALEKTAEKVNETVATPPIRSKEPPYKPKLANADDLIKEGKNSAASHHFNDNPQSNKAIAIARELAKHCWGNNESNWDPTLVEQWQLDINVCLGQGKKKSPTMVHVYVANVITKNIAMNNMPDILAHFNGQNPLMPEIRSELARISHKDRVAAVVTLEFQQSLKDNGCTPMTATQMDGFFTHVATSAEGATRHQEDNIVKNMKSMIEQNAPADRWKHMLEVEAPRIEGVAQRVAAGQFQATPPEQHLPVDRIHRRHNQHIHDHILDKGIGVNVQGNAEGATVSFGTAKTPNLVPVYHHEVAKDPSQGVKRALDETASSLQPRSKISRVDNASDVSQIKSTQSVPDLSLSGTLYNLPGQPSVVPPLRSPESDITVPQRLPDPDQRVAKNVSAKPWKMPFFSQPTVPPTNLKRPRDHHDQNRNVKRPAVENKNAGDYAPVVKKAAEVAVKAIDETVAHGAEIFATPKIVAAATAYNSLERTDHDLEKGYDTTEARLAGTIGAVVETASNVALQTGVNAAAAAIVVEGTIGSAGLATPGALAVGSSALVIGSHLADEASKSLGDIAQHATHTALEAARNNGFFQPETARKTDELLQENSPQPTHR